MQIIIDGKEAVLKKGSSFDFISENRLFSGSDSFTLSITFPLRDCLQNLDIFGQVNRSELPVNDYVFDCEIRDRSFSRFGSLTIVEISDIELKAQFLEGRAEQNFSKDFDVLFVNELDLGKYPVGSPSAISPEEAWNPMNTDWQAVAIPWVSADSGIVHNFAEYSQSSGKYSWISDIRSLSWQPYLLHIVKKICAAVEYSYDFSDWEEDLFLPRLLVCNTLPDSWDLSGYARALPHWTVAEFFEKLELFLRGEFSIDHRSRHIVFRFSYKELESTPAVRIDSIVDEFSSSIDTNTDNCKYLEASAFKYSDHSQQIWKYQSCDWFFNTLQEEDIVRYPDVYAMTQNNKNQLTYDDSGGNHRGPAASGNIGKILYIADNDCYFMLRNISRTETGKNDAGWTTHVYQRIFQPLNEFGAYIPDGSKLEDAEDLEFVPVCIDFTEDKYGFVPFLSFSSYNEPASSMSSSGVDLISSNNNDEFQKTGLQRMIESGEKDSPSEYYDTVSLG
ncbi:MAG: hypothetical protein K2G13_07540, partial [Muribaculaceae bacterium]|nr:hypothetical protein [Muribaculaceae bacterium]